MSSEGHVQNGGGTAGDDEKEKELGGTDRGMASRDKRGGARGSENGKVMRQEVLLWVR